MADQTQADNQAVGTQQTPMPSVNQQTNDQVTATPAAPSEVSGQQDNYSLPEDVSRRTSENFDRLRNELREERKRREELEAIAYQPRKPEENTPLYDPATGYVNVDALTQMQRSTQEALRAKQQFEQYVQRQQEQEAYQSHPELNPDARDHDRELFSLTRAIMTDSMINPGDYGGKELTAKQAADMAKKQRNKVVEQARQEAATQAIEQLTPKEQASLEATGRSDARMSANDYNELSERTRRGDIDAIVQRMKSISAVGS